LHEGEAGKGFVFSSSFDVPKRGGESRIRKASCVICKYIAFSICKTRNAHECLSIYSKQTNKPTGGEAQEPEKPRSQKK